MNGFARRLTGGGIVAATVLGGLLLASTMVGADSWVKYRGEFVEFQNTELGDELSISGQAKMKISNNGTKVDVEIYGLVPDITLTSHLHNKPCDEGQGGGHYQDVEGGATVPPNEIHLYSPGSSDGIVLQEGAAYAEAAGRADWIARTDSAATVARSVVLHGGGAKIACADLMLDS